MSALPIDSPRWITWRPVKRKAKDGSPKTVKEPYDHMSGYPIDACADRDYWRRDELRRDVAHGWVLGRDGKWFYIGFDFDTCRDKGGKLTDWAREALDVLDSYTEVSPSGTGVKTWARVDRETYYRIRELIDGSKNRKWDIGGGDHPPGIQLFLLGYFTVTGKALDDSPVRTIDSKTAQRVIEIGERIKREAEARDDYEDDYNRVLQKLAFASVFKMERPGFYEAVAENDKAQDHVDRQKDGDRAINRSWAKALIMKLAHDMKADGASNGEFVGACMAHPEIVCSRKILTEKEVTDRCYREWRAAPSGASLLKDLRDEDPDRSGNRTRKPTLEVFWGDEDDGADDLEPLIEGFLFQRSLSALYGQYGEGKSFVALDMALSIATGRAWFGHVVERGPVLYVAPEGYTGLKRRRAAWVKHHKRERTPKDFALVRGSLDLMKPDGVTLESIAAEARRRKAVLIVLDTLNAIFGGADENDSAAMSKARHELERLRDLSGAAVFAIHHAGKDISRGLRGSSVLGGALDTALLIHEGRIVSRPPRGQAEGHGSRRRYRLRPAIGGPGEGS